MSEIQTQIPTQTPTLEDVEIKPALWQITLKAIREIGLHFGAKFDTKWLSDQLNAPAESLQFGVAIREINDAIIDEGYALTSRNQSAKFYAVADVEQAESIASAYQRAAMRLQWRTVRLLGGVLNNPTAVLEVEQRRRIASKQEKAAFRLSLMKRSRRLQSYLQQRAPNVIKLLK